MDLDTFFVSCERLLDSRLEGKPVLIGGTSDRGVVASCSYEARAFGIHSAMPMRLAKQLCPEAIVLRGNSGIYSKFSNAVTDVIKESVPIYEKTSVDEFYIDLSGMDKFFGCHKLASEIRKRIIKETGLPISFGLSINKTVSKIATGEAKPNNQLHIVQGHEKPFLSPLSVSKIPMVGKVTYRQLCDLGIKRIQTIQEMPVEMMSKVFGKNGRVIWKKANGIDNSPVVQYSERKSISTERTFDRDTTDVKKTGKYYRCHGRKPDLPATPWQQTHCLRDLQDPLLRLPDLYSAKANSLQFGRPQDTSCSYGTIQKPVPAKVISTPGRGSV